MDKILLMILNSAMYKYKQNDKQNDILRDKKFTYILYMKYCNHFE
jgi:hypothetical protein